VEEARAQLDRIAALDSKLASYVTVMAVQALPDAKRAGVGAVDGRTPGRP
jgi:hypothetical protein